MERGELEAVAREIMEKAEMVSLATMDEGGYPSIRALFNLRNPTWFPGLAPFFSARGPLTIYLGTNRSSVKSCQITRHPKVAVYYALPGNIKGIMLRGEAVPDEEAKAALWVEGWERYYPAGRTDPDYRIWRIDPELARGWYEGAAFEFDL